MPVSVHCPTCGQELLAAAELVGKLALCPHCHTQFPITMPTAQTGSGTPATEAKRPEAPPSVPASSIPVAKPLDLRTAPSMLQPERDAATPPPAPSASDAHAGDSPAATAQESTPNSPPASRTPQSLHLAASLYPPGQSPSPSIAETANAAHAKGQPLPNTATGKAAPSSASRPTAKSSPPAAKRARHSPSKPSREALPARFIAADASETRVELGHDGQLPILQLEEATRIDVDQQNASASNPWLLVAALAFSFGMSAVLLFVDTSGAPAERATKKSARSDIEMYYSRPVAQPQQYRRLLREALQAYNKEDYATERRRYKRVLDLLHAENKDLYSGLTGQVSAPKPPHDRHLEELLSTLVDD